MILSNNYLFVSENSSIEIGEHVVSCHYQQENLENGGLRVKNDVNYSTFFMMFILIAVSNAARYTRECRITFARIQYDLLRFRRNYGPLELLLQQTIAMNYAILVHAGRRNACKRDKRWRHSLLRKSGELIGYRVTYYERFRILHLRTIHKSRKNIDQSRVEYKGRHIVTPFVLGP